MKVAAETQARAEIVQIMEPLRAYVRAHTRQPFDADDVVQEALTRVLHTEDRLTPGSALAYAIVVARNLMADHARDADTLRRHRHRLVDRTSPQRPDEAVLRSEERDALQVALARVPESQRELLLAHVLHDEPVTAIAEETGASSGSISAQLARTRAKLRLDYVLALRGTELPTARCRPVLLALSAGDTRRQNALRAGHHLMSCAACASVSEPLLERRSALAGVAPWLGLGPVIEFLQRVIRQSPGQVAATSAAAVIGTAAVVAAVTTDQPEPSRAPAAVTASPVAGPTTPAASRLMRETDRAPLLPTPAAGLAAFVGDRVVANAVPVLAAPADEGFWIGDPGDRVWVQLDPRGRESRPTIVPGQTVSFTGVITGHDATFAARTGVTGVEGADLLTRQAAHVAVAASAVRIDGR